ncbi:TetR/AcrR family transcriptional regulator C-terminal domain-containing protein [Allokutzneria oryzae]|uniref:TetR/AcrR family transcriptional regulator C-terminal domain-containing protein n=1 Tax=Allokutzneria oryzae TaxID=1378989 RepID=A0ABV6A197_9PSEU
MALDRGTVVRTALRVLDEVGVENLTLRRIATELNVQAPALYWHFKNKQELVDEMATTVLVEALSSAEHAEDWESLLIGYGRALRAALLSHRDGAKVFSGTYLTDPDVYKGQERGLRMLVDAGFTLADAVSGLITVHCYATGHAVEEQAAQPGPGEVARRYDPQARAERIDAETLPLAHEASTQLFGDFDDRFERGLRLIVRGMRP